MEYTVYTCRYFAESKVICTVLCSPEWLVWFYMYVLLESLAIKRIELSKAVYFHISAPYKGCICDATEP